MQTLRVPEDTASLAIDGETYTPDENGHISVPNAHLQQAVSLGCVDPDAEPPAMVTPTIDPETAPDLAAALIAENEDLKGDVALLTSANDVLRDSNTQLADSLEKAIQTISDQQGVIDGLRAASETTESGSETRGADEDGLSASEGADASGGASPSLPPLADERPAFDDAEAFGRDELRDWLASRGVLVAGNVSRATAEKLCLDTYAEQKALQDAGQE